MAMRFLWADGKRALCEPRFFWAVSLGVVWALCSGLFVAHQGVADGLSFFTKSQSLVLPFFMPLLCALPYSNLYMLERATKFEHMMRLRYRHQIWMFLRLLTNGLVSGLTALAPGVALLLGSLLWGQEAFCLAVYQVLGLNFLFGVAFGSLSYGLGFVNTALYIPLVAPQVLYLFCIYAFPILGLQSYYPPLAYAPWILPSVASMPHSITALLSLCGVSLVLVCVGVMKKAVGR